MPKIPGINHLEAVRPLEKAGFRIVRKGKLVSCPTAFESLQFLGTIPQTS